MSTFTIDNDNNITACAALRRPSKRMMQSQRGLTPRQRLVSADWPLSRFVEIWNSVPGQSPVKKFQDRKKAVARLWKAIQPLSGTGQCAGCQRRRYKPVHP